MKTSKQLIKGLKYTVKGNDLAEILKVVTRGQTQGDEIVKVVAKCEDSNWRGFVYARAELKSINDAKSALITQYKYEELNLCEDVGGIL